MASHAAKREDSVHRQQEGLHKQTKYVKANAGRTEGSTFKQEKG
jgi:hypothetical protein